MSLFTATTVDEVKRLIELGHDVNFTDNCGKSVLHYACSNGNLDIVKILCEAGANVNKMSSWHHLPIDMAANTGHLIIIKYFIENYSVKLDKVLYYVSIFGHIDVLDYLLTLNLELNSPRYNPLIAACKYGIIDVVDRLLYAGVDTNIVNEYGRTAIEEAAFNNKLDVVKRLVMFGANYHTCGGKLLRFSCQYLNNEMSEFLIDLGCNPNYCIHNMTSLMYACVHNNLKIIKLLLKRGADPNFINDHGEKAIDYCKSDEARALFIKN